MLQSDTTLAKNGIAKVKKIEMLFEVYDMDDCSADYSAEQIIILNSRSYLGNYLYAYAVKYE